MSLSFAHYKLTHDKPSDLLEWEDMDFIYRYELNEDAIEKYNFSQFFHTAKVDSNPAAIVYILDTIEDYQSFDIHNAWISNFNNPLVEPKICLVGTLESCADQILEFEKKEHIQHCSKKIEREFCFNFDRQLTFVSYEGIVDREISYVEMIHHESMSMKKYDLSPK